MSSVLETVSKMAEKTPRVRKKAKSDLDTTGKISKSKKSVKKQADIFNDDRNPVRVRNITSKGDLYFISQEIHEGTFRLWHQVPDGYELISESDSPLDFDDLIPW